MKTLSWITVVIFAPMVEASTWVGNGGGAGDVELAVTEKQIEETFTSLRKRVDSGDSSLCSCSKRFAHRAICEPLNNLSEKEAEFCAKAMITQSSDVASLVKRVSFKWTNDPIQVSEGKEIRAVDAVTDPDQKTITLNLRRFLRMSQFDRVFLLTHELLHLTTLNGKRMEDVGPIGPFEGANGGRRLLNAMGAAAAVHQLEMPREVKKYRARLYGSKAWKRFWFELSLGKADYLGDDDQTFQSDAFRRFQIGFRYVLGNWSFGTSYRHEHNKETVLSGVNVFEKVDMYSLAAGYRLFLFGQPWGFWGQSHFLIQGSLDFVQAQTEIHDAFVGSKHKADAIGGTLSVSYYQPIFVGFWAHVGTALEYHPYSYKNINLEYKDPIFSPFAGVAYAF